MPKPVRSARGGRLPAPRLESLEDRLLLTVVMPTRSTRIASATGSITGVVFNDANGDGLRQASEMGLAGRIVYLDSNNSGGYDPSDLTAVTAADGTFRFNGLAPGRYLIGQLPAPGWQPTSWQPTASTSTAGFASSPADRLIGLDRFRGDRRFTSIDGRGYSVVVIDTGIESSHSFFGPDQDNNGIADAIVYQYDFIDSKPLASDGDGHGTYIASLIGSRDRQNPGVAPGVNLIALKALDDTGNGSFATIERALRWVTSNASKYNIVAVNLSLSDGGNYTHPLSLYDLGDELKTLAALNVTVVAAAGNNYGTTSVAGLSYPAADPSALAVGSVWASNQGGGWSWDNGVEERATSPDKIAGFSQRAPGLNQVFAPGMMLLGAGLGGGTTSQSGTSGAAAVVSGIVALAQQMANNWLGRSLSPGELFGLLTKTGVSIRDNHQGDNVPRTGATFSRVDVYALGQAILAMSAVQPGKESGSVWVTVTGGQLLSGLNLGQRRVPGRTAPLLYSAGPLTASAQGVRVSDLLLGRAAAADGRGLGLVITGSSGLGRWQISTNSGHTWEDLGSVAVNKARLLAPSDSIRFVAAPGWQGTARLTYRAWDMSLGRPGQRVNLLLPNSVGGNSAFSSNQFTVQLSFFPA